MYFSDQDQFELVGFSVPYRQRYRSVELRCGVPGEDGELVALLPFAQGVLSHDELIPVGPAGACGVAITTLASLLEALLRGELYVAIELIDPPGVQLRGQFPSP